MKVSSFIPYPLAFQRIPLLPRNCKSYERCTYVTIGATLMGRRSY